MSTGERLREIGHDRLDTRIVGEPLPHPIDHRGRPVERDHVTVREPIQEQGSDAPGAAAGVEHPLVATKIEPPDDRLSPRVMG